MRIRKFISHYAFVWEIMDANSVVKRPSYDAATPLSKRCGETKPDQNFIDANTPIQLLLDYQLF